MDKLFATRLRNIRKVKEIKQSELASYLGVTKQSISKWEKGGATPTISTIIKLSKYFEVTTDYLLGLSNYPTMIEINMNLENTKEDGLNIQENATLFTDEYFKIVHSFYRIAKNPNYDYAKIALLALAKISKRLYKMVYIKNNTSETKPDFSPSIIYDSEQDGETYDEDETQARCKYEDLLFHTSKSHKILDRFFIQLIE